MTARAGVLLDLDGTLVDTNYLHTLAWSRALADVGEWAPMHAIHHLIGAGSDQLVRRLCGHEVPGATEAHAERYRELMGEARVFPGARETLQRWHAEGLAVVLASSAPRDELEPMLALLDLDGVLDGVTSADDVDRSKPHPDVLHAALAAGGVDATQAVLVGDSVWDVEAARRAGLTTLAVETGGVCAADLLAAGAAQVFHDIGAMADLDADALLHRTGVEQAAVNRALDPPA